MNERNLKYGKNPSAIRELFEYGKSLALEIGEENVFDFSIGNPYLPTPKIVNEKLKELIDKRGDSDLHKYTSAIGDLDARKAISDNLKLKYNAEVSENYIYLTHGAAMAIRIALGAVISSDEDEVIIFAPHFPDYNVFIASSGAKRILVNPDENFFIDFDDLERKINRNTKMVIINSPNNPTGVFYDENVIIRLSSLLKAKEDEYHHPIYLLSDEPYRDILFVDKKYPFVTNYYKNSLVAYSFSKSLSLPGERIGYLLINPKADNADDLLYASLGAGRALGNVCMNSLFQYVIPEIINSIDSLDFYKNNSLYFYEELTKIGYHVIKPEGAFYLFMKEPYDGFQEKANRNGILMPSSESFDYPGYLRISTAVDPDKIKKSIPIFKKLYEEK